MSDFIGPKPDSGNVGEQILDGDYSSLEQDDREDDVIHYDPDEDERQAMREIIRSQGFRLGALHDELLELKATDAHQRIAELEEALALATGPHCSSCGCAIDPDTCHCGASSAQHGNVLDEGHGFVPMGCMCGYIGSESAIWPRIATGLREQLWRARRRSRAAGEIIERVRTMVQHWRSQQGFNAALIDALAVTLDAYDREPLDG